MLGDDIAAALPDLQLQAESMMRDTCVIKRPTGGFTEDPDGYSVPAYEPTPIYTGKCKVQGDDAPSDEVGGGET
ncbi:MAG: DUF6093 family protein, partial [Ilumatobacteraceae bacterium]